MDDAGPRWHNEEVIEGSLAPFEERESFLVPTKLKLFVLLLGISCAGGINLYRVIDDQVNRAERVDLLRVASESRHGIAHGGEVDYGGHTCEVLQENSGWLEGDLEVQLGAFSPVENSLDVSL